MSLDSAKKFVNKVCSLNDFLAHLQKAEAKEREAMIHKAGFDFTFDELKQVLEKINDDTLNAVYGGASGSSLGSVSRACKDGYCYCVGTRPVILTAHAC